MFRNGEKKRRFATKGALALLALATVAVLTGVSFASTTSVTSVTVTASDSGIATVDPAGEDGFHGSEPGWSVTSGTAGTTGDGDLYIIDTGDYTGDIMVTLYITNVADLAQRYTYMNLNTTVHEENGSGGWNPVADSYLTLIGGYVTFILEQGVDGGKYSLGIDGGSFYANSKTSGGDLNPDFFVDIRQA